MKKAVLRDNVRNIKLATQSGKNPHSQSPPHKKLLKKIEGIQKNTTSSKNDFSLQDKLVNPEQQEEAQDFRVEIERKYKKSYANKEFRFPLHFPESSDTHSQENSSDLSSDSLKYVTVYDLASQNKPKRPALIPQKTNAYSTDRARIQFTHHQEPAQASSTSNFIDLDQEDSDEQPLETKIRDKSSETYKKLIKLLESNSMFSHNSTNPQPENNFKAQTQQKSQKVQPKYQNFQLQDDSENDRLTTEPREQDDLKKHYYTTGYQEHEEVTNRDQSSKIRPRNAESVNSNSRSNGVNSRQINSRGEGQKSSKLLESSSPRKADPSYSIERNTGGSQQMSRAESTLKKTFSYDKTAQTRVDSALNIDKTPTNYSTKT